MMRTMNNILYYILFGGILLHTSCDDSLEVVTPVDFEIDVEKTSFTVGEEVVFQLKGDPSIITFYSGEIGRDYAFREGRIVPPGSVSLGFESRVLYGAQPNQLSILVSSDYSGERNIAAITRASWTDVTSRYNLAAADIGDYAHVGTADLTDLTQDGKQLYLAFKYVFDPSQGSPRTWNIRQVQLMNTTSVGTTQLADHLTGGFELFYVGPKQETGRSSIASGSITLRSNAAGALDQYTEDWCVSKGFDLGTKDLGPDRPIKVKGNSDARTGVFTYVYDSPGVYTAYFVATNATAKNQESVIRNVTIEITP